jgi:hypothetical protein
MVTFRWNEERRFLLRCELDAAYFHLYGIERDDVDYTMETFPIVKRKDEKLYGEYRTKRVKQAILYALYAAYVKLLKNMMDMRESMSPKPVTENTLCYVITFVALLLLLGE